MLGAKRALGLRWISQKPFLMILISSKFKKNRIPIKKHEKLVVFDNVSDFLVTLRSGLESSL